VARVQWVIESIGRIGRISRACGKTPIYIYQPEEEAPRVHMHLARGEERKDH